jgi:hypothetical protein
MFENHCTKPFIEKSGSIQEFHPSIHISLLPEIHILHYLHSDKPYTASKIMSLLVRKAFV